MPDYCYPLLDFKIVRSPDAFAYMLPVDYTLDSWSPIQWEEIKPREYRLLEGEQEAAVIVFSVNQQIELVHVDPTLDLDVTGETITGGYHMRWGEPYNPHESSQWNTVITELWVSNYVFRLFTQQEPEGENYEPDIPEFTIT